MRKMWRTEREDSMTLVAIDPGHTESAWVLWDGRRLLAFDKESNDLLLDRIRRELWPFVLPEFAVIEQIKSYGMAVGAEVFETCVWTGRFMEAFGPGMVDRLPRLEVKMHLCHDSRAKDANIRAALIDRFGGPQSVRKGGPLYKVSGDVWAALAVAVTWADRQTVRGAA